MYKVLLADDEPMALEMLKYVLDWNGIGFTICGACSNGKEVIEAIDTYQPDVVITDIRMPVMDGLDMIRYVREHGKEATIFIVVSGYGEFEYAKKAMQYAVKYYLQKPIFEEEIYEVIIEVKEQLDKRLRDRESSHMYDKAALEGILSNILLGNTSEENINSLKNFIDNDTITMGWNCIVIEFEGSEQPEASEKLKGTRLQVRKALDKIAESNSGVFALEQSSNIFIVLISLKNQKHQETRIKNIAEEIYQSLISTVISGFTVGVGEPVMDMNVVKHSYVGAVVALSYRFYTGLNSLIFYNEIKEKKFNFEFNDIFMSNKILEAVEETDVKKVKSMIGEVFEYFEKHRIHPDIVRMFTSNTIGNINNLFIKSEAKTKDLIEKNTIGDLKAHERTMHTLRKFFEAACLSGCEHFIKERTVKTGDNIVKIEAFIKENYKKNITIRELAEYVYMHPAYLGQLFIRTFGIGFNEYIHIMRIEEGKRLIDGTNLKNNEIAHALGYSSYNSFLLKFQKYTGMKPTEFRNRGH